MNSKKPLVVFFGSGPVAAKSLGLLQKHCEIEAVVTKPSTLKEMAAVAKEIPIHSVSNGDELDALIENNSFKSRLGILIDFGIIVSRGVIDSFEKGIINSHFSLLPEWRGADPITFSILSGQTQTGVSLMLLVEAMDEGPILSFGIQDITSSMTEPELTHRLVLLSDGLLAVEIPRYLTGETKLMDQEDIGSKMMLNYPKKPTYSRKLTKEDGILDFTKPADQLDREVRAFITWPKSRTTIANKDVVILRTAVDSSVTGKRGNVFQTKDKKIGIFTSKGALIIEELKPAGKNAMTARAFLAGYGSEL